MIIAGDTMNHQVLSKFPLQTFLPLPSLIHGFYNDRPLWQRESSKAILGDYAVHRYAVEPPPPINRLPIELLADIFALTLQNDANRFAMSSPLRSRNFPGLSFSPGSSSDPMILAKVCRHWRGVALTTPMLWSSMAIKCTTNRRHHIPLLRTWLERSDNCPLDIVLLEPFRESKELDQWWPQQNALVTEILSLLINQSHRWKTIDFRFSIKIPLVLTTLPAGSFRALESATIYSSQVLMLSFDGLPLLDKVWDVVYASPSFRRGHWQSEYLEHRSQSIPWTQLTHIEVTISIDSLFEILPFCHNLTDFRFTDPCLTHDSIFFPRFPSSPRLSTAPVHLPYLRNLFLDIKQPPDIIFQHLTLPSLVSFAIRQYDSCQDDRSEASLFKELLARSQCRLQKYSYGDFGLDGEEILLDVLASPYMSSLTYLDVESPVTAKLVKLLTLTPGSHTTLPRLEKLVIGRCTTPPGALTSMALSRRLKVDNFSVLRDIQLGNWDCHEVDLEGFRVLAEKGMFVYA